jgi:hypothetical protein
MAGHLLAAARLACLDFDERGDELVSASLLGVILGCQLAAAHGWIGSKRWVYTVNLLWFAMLKAETDSPDSPLQNATSVMSDHLIF